MKMRPEHYQRLVQMLDKVANPAVVQMLELAAAADPRTKDVAKRVRWDLLWSTPLATRQPWFDEVYTYCEDDHVDTALRQYMKERRSAAGV